jgi:type II secretory pathway component PulK
MIFHQILGRGRRDPVGRCAKRMKRQRGVALIIALILVALSTILATKLTFDGFLERRRAIGVLAAEQALQFGMGAEALAADVLAQDLQNSAQLTIPSAPWAQPTQPLPITPQENPEGEPIGTLQGQLEDMQGRFNLNNLGRVIPGTGPQGTVAAINQDAEALAQFQRLLVLVGLEPKWAGPDLHLADSALPHRQLAHDVAHRIDEPAGIRCGPLSQDRTVRNGVTNRESVDQYLHGPRGGA